MSWCSKDQVKPEVEVRHLLGNIDTNRLGCKECFWGFRKTSGYNKKVLLDIERVRDKECFWI